MKRSTLKREGKKWVNEKIITDQQLKQLLAQYPQKSPNFVIILFAILLTGIGFLTFIFSDWAQQPYFSRLLIVIVAMLVLYSAGYYFYKSSSQLLGISFIVLGYIVFGSGLFLGIRIYDVFLTSAWPFVIWSLVGLFLYMIFDHKMLFSVGIVVTIAGQIYSGLVFSSFDIFIFLMLILGFAHFVYHRAHMLYGYLFSVSFVIQMLVLTLVEQYSYYWLIVFYLALYILSDLVPKETLKAPLKYISLVSMFIFGMFQALLLQDVYFIDHLNFEWSFIVVWLVFITLSIGFKIKVREPLTIVDLILYLPLVYISSSVILTLVSLFAFSLMWLVIGFKKESNEQIIVGTIAFLLSTFTAYIQYAWEMMDKSLFFLIGGFLLFVLSFILEKQRRSVISKNGGDHE